MDGRPIIQTAFRTLPPSYTLLHVDAFTSAREKNGLAIDPVLYVDSGENSVCCHRSAGGLHILFDPLFVFSFLDAVVQILQEYLGELSTASLKDNFDVVYQVGRMVERSEGYRSSAILTEQDTCGHRCLGVGEIGIPTVKWETERYPRLSSAAPAPFSSPIPWRKAGLRYNNNEIYFDIVEELEATVNRSGNVVASNVWGKILCKSNLSGTPDLSFSLSNSKALRDYSFHPCVR
ncbi:adaptor complexes medium subunit family domain-containing protein [Rhizoctonia solani AG-1 IA]|uniref:Adaptor complexes medium subunit family domain-containing protein n=1 Tax=Thanatephorus cucumeris (strain AG1-IA) TaxID=983506 RepID=L8WV03_THACA|nr:adaptor complexes medium subunit family domain-containing protein [Rhizoctonia solani AG-1 IA]